MLAPFSLSPTLVQIEAVNGAERTVIVISVIRFAPFGAGSPKGLGFQCWELWSVGVACIQDGFFQQVRLHMHFPLHKGSKKSSRSI